LFRLEEPDLEHVFGLSHQDFSSTVPACKQKFRPPDEIRDQVTCAFCDMIVIEELFRREQRYTCSAKQVFVNKLITLASDP